MLLRDPMLSESFNLLRDYLLVFWVLVFYLHVCVPFARSTCKDQKRESDPLGLELMASG